MKGLHTDAPTHEAPTRNNTYFSEQTLTCMKHSHAVLQTHVLKIFSHVWLCSVCFLVSKSDCELLTLISTSNRGWFSWSCLHEATWNKDSPVDRQSGREAGNTHRNTARRTCSMNIYIILFVRTFNLPLSLFFSPSFSLSFSCCCWCCYIKSRWENQHFFRLCTH